MRLKKTLINIGVSFLFEVVSIISGLIIPVIIIKRYGSDVNGLTQSITNFLGYVAILQLGAGSVIKAILYKPLADNDDETISVILKTSNRFFKKIGAIGVIYMIVLSIVYPLFIAKQHEFLFTFSLILIIGIGVLGQYFFGLTYQMILEADQKSYVFSVVQIIIIVLNTVLAIVVTKVNLSIQWYKMLTSLLFLIRPIVLNIYVNKKYNIDKNANPDNRLMRQRWDGFAHGLAYYIHSRADVFVLTIFSSMSMVSVYSVYALITTGLNSVLSRIDTAVRPVFGNIIAKSEDKTLIDSFNAYNTVNHIFCSIVFTTAAITASRFVYIYTNGITDADYIQPIFSLIIISAEYVYCLRAPYNSVIFASNLFKETKISAFIEAGINIFISSILVLSYGLIGVAIGTLAAMIYRTVYFVVFLSKNVIRISWISQLKRYLISLLCFTVTIALFYNFPTTANNYLSLAIYAAEVMVASTIINLLINFLFVRSDVLFVLKKTRIIR